VTRTATADTLEVWDEAARPRVSWQLASDDARGFEFDTRLING
jgi:hypothetical protein